MEINKSITLVDLAGSERAKRTDNQNESLKESNKINQSLSCLARCIEALKKNQLPPFRESKLTRYLSDYFEQDNNIIMIANVNPSHADFSETMRTLAYTAVARQVTIVSHASKSSAKLISKQRVKKEKEEKIALNYTERKLEESLDKENLLIFNDF